MFGLKFTSEVNWGGTRNNPDPGRIQFMRRNQGYLYQKYKVFLEKFRETPEYFRFKKVRPFSIPGITADKKEIREAVANFYRIRKRMVGMRIHFISKFLKLPLKWLLIRLRLY